MIKCFICGRKLSDPKSIQLGAGSKCYESVRRSPKKREQLKKYVATVKKQLELNLRS